MRHQLPKISGRKDSADVGRLASSFATIRVLHCASIQPSSHLEILNRLRRHNPAITPVAVNRTLARMVRCGWLKKLGTALSGEQRKACHYCLTAEGRQVLDSARERLRQLVSLWSNAKT